MISGLTEMQNVDKYSARITYSPEDQGFIATVPELPGCSAFGETRAEAATEIVHAIEAWISAAEAAGNLIPPPVAIENELPSGRFLVRVAKTVHAQLTSAAQREGVSLNQYVGTILATASLGDIYSQASTGAHALTVTGKSAQAAAIYNAGGYSMMVLDHVVQAGLTAHASSAKPSIFTYRSRPAFTMMSLDTQPRKRRSRTPAHG